MKTINLSEMVAGTSTNDSGLMLFLEIDKVLSSGDDLKISLANCSSLSSSFLSSSFGEVYDKYGYDIIKTKITLTNYSSILASQIKSFLDRLDVSSEA